MKMKTSESGTIWKWLDRSYIRGKTNFGSGSKETFGIRERRIFEMSWRQDARKINEVHAESHYLQRQEWCTVRKQQQSLNFHSLPLLVEV